jgi:hypothetical protein
MATVTTFTDGVQPTRHLRESVAVVRKTFNFSTTNVDSGDTAYLIPIDAYSAVKSLSVEIKTANTLTSTTTADFGIQGDDVTNDPNGLDDAVALNAAAGTITQSAFGTDAGLLVNFGASGGYIDMTPDVSLDNGEIVVTAEVLLFNEVAD